MITDHENNQEHNCRVDEIEYIYQILKSDENYYVLFWLLLSHEITILDMNKRQKNI